jgi:hypothetical protein
MLTGVVRGVIPSNQSLRPLDDVSITDETNSQAVGSGDEDEMPRGTSSSGRKDWLDVDLGLLGREDGSSGMPSVSGVKDAR